MIITNAAQTNHAAAANQDAVICHHKVFSRGTLEVLCRIRALVTDACFLEILQRGHRGHAHDRRAGPCQMDTPHGARLGDRPLPRLFRDHVVCLPRLTSAVRGWCAALMAGGSGLLEGLQALTPDSQITAD